MTQMIIPPSGTLRQHVDRPSMWSRAAGTDFWFNFGPTSPGIAADEVLTDYGWTLTSITQTAGSGADLLTSADQGVPNVSALDGANDLLLSGPIFGDYGHGLMAGRILGYTPTKLCMEINANFGTATAAETISGFGFSTGSSLTATNHLAFIYSDGTNFAIRGTPGTGGFIDLGALVDNSFHLWKIVCTSGGTVEWFMDDVSQGTITLVTDVFPTSFSASVTTTNRVNLDWAHIWYE